KLHCISEQGVESERLYTAAQRRRGSATEQLVELAEGRADDRRLHRAGERYVDRSTILGLAREQYVDVWVRSLDGVEPQRSRLHLENVPQNRHATTAREGQRAGHDRPVGVVDSRLTGDGDVEVGQ